MRTKNRKATVSAYYDMQKLQDKLYADSVQGKEFKHLMQYISLSENIMLAYRTIKTNNGSHTAGTDKKDIEFLANMEEKDFIQYIQTKLHDYHPKKVRRVEIPKPNGKTRPLGIPCIADRIVQQCILQILEPICEAKFYDKSYGFRPNRSAENAIADVERLMQRSHCTYVVNIDIKGFFDNVNHRKLLRQMWTLGIRDTKLQQVIKQMLKAPIQMPDKTIIYPDKGTPQGGILSPLLANIVLNELDWWIHSQWLGQTNLMNKSPKPRFSKNGERNYGSEYTALRKSQLKEMYVVRYADDFKIFCKTRNDAIKIQQAVVDWLGHRLKLQVSEEKTCITNLKRRSCEFLGFKLSLKAKGNKSVVNAHMCDKAQKRATDKLKNQIKLIQKPKDDTELYQRIGEYNSMVVGLQNYYGIANNVCKDFGKIQFVINNTIKNRLTVQKEGKFKNQFLEKRYGKSKQVIWLMEIPIVPIGYYKSRNPMHKKKSINQYTPEGRLELYKPPDINTEVMLYIMRNPVKGRTVEYNDNRVSLYVGQHGKCAITGEELKIGYMHCHHKTPKHLGGDDKYRNLIFITEPVHKLVHATKKDTISLYMEMLNLNTKQFEKLNQLRVLAGLEIIE